MKRFWTTVELEPLDGGWGVTLDGRPVRTPARERLVLPTPALADAVAAEWRDCGETIDPRAMPFTGLANAALDRVATDPQRFADDLSAYAQSDLLLYRADMPRALVARQAAAWDPLLDWARQRFDVAFTPVTGIMPVSQPEETIRRLSTAVASLGPYQLAGLQPVVTIGGSLVVALALYEKAIAPEAAWDAVGLDVAWQAEQWGVDADAAAAEEGRREAFLSAAKFLELLRG